MDQQSNRQRPRGKLRGRRRRRRRTDLVSEAIRIDPHVRMMLAPDEIESL